MQEQQTSGNCARVPPQVPRVRDLTALSTGWQRYTSLAVFCAMWGCGEVDQDPHPPPVADIDTRDSDVLPGEGCAPAGITRDPVGGEVGSYCRCQTDGRWACYGPEPSEPGEGNSPLHPRCEAGFEQRTDQDDGSCLLSWSDCTDKHRYMFRCLSGSCLCLVDTEPTVELEPGTACVTALSEVNALCGWGLESDEP